MLTPAAPLNSIEHIEHSERICRMHQAPFGLALSALERTDDLPARRQRYGPSRDVYGADLVPGETELTQHLRIPTHTNAPCCEWRLPGLTGPFLQPPSLTAGRFAVCAIPSAQSRPHRSKSWLARFVRASVPGSCSHVEGMSYPLMPVFALTPTSILHLSTACFLL